MVMSVCWGHRAKEELRLASRQESGLPRPLCAGAASDQVHTVCLLSSFFVD